MHSTGIMLLLLAALFAGNALGDALGDVTRIPATQDVYISMGENNVSVYNQTYILLCAVNATGNRTEMISYPGAPIIQFDISGLNFTNNDIAVLVLKATCIQKQADPIMVALMSIGSDWNESSDYNTFLVNILPAWKIIKMNDATAMSSNTDGDSIFAFDVSQKLRDAREEGNKISFLLEAISNNSSEISFRSRESGEGPCLVVMPYPDFSPDLTMQPDLTINSSLQPDQAPEIPENVSLTGLQTNLTTNPQADLAGAEIPAVGNLQSNQMEAISNRSSEIFFLSRESCQGPCLVVMPYPISTPDVTIQTDSAQQINSSIQHDPAPKLPENVSLTGLQTNMTTNQQAGLANAEIPAVGSLQSNQTMDEKLALPIK